MYLKEGNILYGEAGLVKISPHFLFILEKNNVLVYLTRFTWNFHPSF